MLCNSYDPYKKYMLCVTACNLSGRQHKAPDVGSFTLISLKLTRLLDVCAVMICFCARVEGQHRLQVCDTQRALQNVTMSEG